VIVNTTEPGFVENAWVDRTLHIGDQVRLTVAMPDPRCVMTTAAQPGLPQEILRSSRASLSTTGSTWQVGG
jgi:uncharacterized protein